MPNVDVIVTTEGGLDTARAVRRGGGLVGTASNHEPPSGVPIDFIDWPFAAANPSVDRHIELTRELQPKYAVAPDVDVNWPLEDALEVADELSRNAQIVIVVPKRVHPSKIPAEFRIGLPFRDNFDTRLGVNTFAEFSVAASVHILGVDVLPALKGEDSFSWGFQDSFFCSLIYCRIASLETLPAVPT